MTRGQVASVSIGSGFRNAPGMPEPNIFNSVATSGSAGPLLVLKKLSPLLVLKKLIGASA